MRIPRNSTHLLAIVSHIFLSEFNAICLKATALRKCIKYKNEGRSVLQAVDYDKLRVSEGLKSPSKVQGRSSGGGLGADPPEAEAFM